MPNPHRTQVMCCSHEFCALDSANDMNCVIVNVLGGWERSGGIVMKIAHLFDLGTEAPKALRDHHMNRLWTYEGEERWLHIFFLSTAALGTKRKHVLVALIPAKKSENDSDSDSSDSDSWNVPLMQQARQHAPQKRNSSEVSHSAPTTSRKALDLN